MFGIETKYIDELKRSVVNWKGEKDIAIFEQLGFQIQAPAEPEKDCLGYLVKKKSEEPAKEGHCHSSHSDSFEENMCDENQIMIEALAEARAKEVECLQFLVFSESNFWYGLYSTFISIMCLITSYIYMYVATFRNGLANELNQGLFIFFEVCFLIHMILQFFKAYELSDESSDKKEERSMSKISLNYIKTYFIIDLIPLLPLQYWPLPDNREKIFYILKVTRLEKGFRLLNISRFMAVVKKAYFSYLESKFKQYPELAMSKKGEYQISLHLICIQYVMKISEMVIIILNTSYIIGVLWFFICSLNEEFFHDSLFKDMSPDQMSVVQAMDGSGYFLTNTGSPPLYTRSVKD